MIKSFVQNYLELEYGNWKNATGVGSLLDQLQLERTIMRLRIMLVSLDQQQLAVIKMPWIMLVSLDQQQLV
jgi:hypothetical protein